MPLVDLYHGFLIPWADPCLLKSILARLHNYLSRCPDYFVNSTWLVTYMSSTEPDLKRPFG
jgi:hypothetical protein